MKQAINKGFSFGLTSGVITTLGLIVGLESSTGSIKIVISGIIVIAIADAFSDSLGIHMAVESENRHSTEAIWAATLMTFLSKFAFAMIFIVPFLIFPLEQAIIASIMLGLGIITVFSYLMAKKNSHRPWTVVAEHLAIAVLVIIATHYIGGLAAGWR